MAGTWRSLVARLDGVQEVASSNLVVPTMIDIKANIAFFILYEDKKNYVNDVAYKLEFTDHRHIITG